MTQPQRVAQQLIVQLQSYQACDRQESASLDETLRWLETAADPFDQQVATHVTAAAIVLDESGRILVHRHKRLGIWLQPGGHIEPGERPDAAAIRETREETGIATRHTPAGPSIVHVDAHAGPKGHRHLDLRFLLFPMDTAHGTPAPGESGEIAWWTREYLAAHADVSLQRAAQAAIDRSPFS